jgi:hypothetical protein
MTVETATYISDLNTSYPAAGDSQTEGDDHIRLVKSTVKATFPNISGAVTPTHTELNYVDGVTSAIQTQLDAKAPKGAVTASGLTMATSRILGRTTASSGAVEEISIGSNLTLSAGTLSASAGGLTLGTPVATTSGTSIDFTSIPATVKQIFIAYSGVSTNGTSAIQVQIGDSGGIETSGYAGSTSGAANSSWSAGALLHDSGTAAGRSYSGVITLTLMNSSTNTWAITVNTGRTDSNGGSYGGGAKALTATLDRVRITTAGGADTFDAGEINISYH